MAKRSTKVASTRVVETDIEFAEFTPEEQRAANAIVERAVLEAMIRPQERMDLLMDLSAVHAKVPLRLGALVEADRFNFAHDIGGIRYHLDRTTGELNGCFLPRFAKPRVSP